MPIHRRRPMTPEEKAAHALKMAADEAKSKRQRQIAEIEESMTHVMQIDKKSFRKPVLAAMKEAGFPMEFAMLRAAAVNRADILEELLEIGCSVSARYHHHLPPLMEAAQHDSDRAFSFLLERGADPWEVISPAEYHPHPRDALLIACDAPSPRILPLITKLPELSSKITPAELSLRAGRLIEKLAHHLNYRHHRSPRLGEADSELFIENLEALRTILRHCDFHGFLFRHESNLDCRKEHPLLEPRHPLAHEHPSKLHDDHRKNPNAGTDNLGRKIALFRNLIPGFPVPEHIDWEAVDQPDRLGMGIISYLIVRHHDIMPLEKGSLMRTAKEVPAGHFVSVIANAHKKLGAQFDRPEHPHWKHPLHTVLRMARHEGSNFSPMLKAVMSAMKQTLQVLPERHCALICEDAILHAWKQFENANKDHYKDANEDPDSGRHCSWQSHLQAIQGDLENVVDALKPFLQGRASVKMAASLEETAEGIRMACKIKDGKSAIRGAVSSALERSLLLFETRKTNTIGPKTSRI